MAEDVIESLTMPARKGSAVEALQKLAHGYQKQADESVRSARRAWLCAAIGWAAAACGWLYAFGVLPL